MIVLRDTLEELMLDYQHNCVNWHIWIRPAHGLRQVGRRTSYVWEAHAEGSDVSSNLHGTGQTEEEARLNAGRAINERA